MTYTSSRAQAGRLATLGIGPVAGTVSPTYIAIGELKEFAVSGSQWGTEDVSNFESLSDMEFITTMRDNGTVTLTGNRVSTDAGQAALNAAFASGSLYMFNITFPKNLDQVTTGDVVTLNALVMGSDFTVAVNKATTFSIKLKVSGLPVKVEGA